MATRKTLRCRQCGYECHVYEGLGFFGQHITPVICPNCHTIQNLSVGGILGQVAPSMSSEAGWICPRCGSEDIRLWDGHTCPKCGGEMHDADLDTFWT